MATRALADALSQATEAAYGVVRLAADGETSATDVVTGDDSRLAAAADLATHLADAADAHDASAISFAPSAGIAATDVQAAIVEDAGDLAAHLADATAAHAASAISFAPNGSIAATTVQAAIQEVRDEASGAISVREQDGSPSVSGVTTIEFATGTVVADQTGGVVRVTPPSGGGGAALTVQEIDGTPLDAAVAIIRVPNGTLTDNGAGDVTLDYGAPVAVRLARELVGVGGVASIVIALDLTGYDSILVTGRLRAETTAADQDVWCRLNADTASNYAYSILFQDDTATPSRIINLNTALGLHLGGAPRGNRVAGGYSSFEASLIGAGLSTMRKVCNSQSAWFDSTVDWQQTHSKGDWRSTAVVTSLTIYVGTGDIAEGSLVCVYGIKGV